MQQSLSEKTNNEVLFPMIMMRQCYESQKKNVARYRASLLLVLLYFRFRLKENVWHRLQRRLLEFTEPLSPRTISDLKVTFHLPFFFSTSNTRANHQVFLPGFV